MYKKKFIAYLCLVKKKKQHLFFYFDYILKQLVKLFMSESRIQNLAYRKIA